MAIKRLISIFIYIIVLSSFNIAFALQGFAERPIMLNATIKENIGKGNYSLWIIPREGISGPDVWLNMDVYHESVINFEFLPNSSIDYGIYYASGYSYPLFCLLRISAKERVVTVTSPSDAEAKADCAFSGDPNKGSFFIYINDKK